MTIWQIEEEARTKRLAEMAIGNHPKDAPRQTVVDPTTGGKKDVKLARYDLIPLEPFKKVARQYSFAWGNQQSWPPHEAIRNAAEWRFENGDEIALEVLGAIIIAQLREEANLSGSTHSFYGMPGQIAEWLACCYGFGASKYSDNNWRRGYKWTLSWAAMMRHLMEASAETLALDSESKQPHLAHALWHCLSLIEWHKTHPELDDRNEFAWLEASE